MKWTMLLMLGFCLAEQELVFGARVELLGGMAEEGEAEED